MTESVEGPIAAHVFADADRHAAGFARGEPFRHVVIDGFLAPAFAARLLDDFPPFAHGSARDESGALGGKATVERVRALGPAYAALDDLVKSPAMLDLVARITGIPDLIYDPWYFGGGTHENRSGQDLDPHVDFNRHPVEGWHRRLNLIVYLNREWDDAWGGALELHSDPRAADDRVTTVTPAFNRCVIFETTETSWHGFARIATPRAELTRKSIALYFYTRERPVEELADPHSTIYVDRPLPDRFCAGFVLDERDVEDLRRLIERRDQHNRRLYADNTRLANQLAFYKKTLGPVIGVARRIRARLARR